MQGSLHAANTIVRRLDGKSTKPYKYRDLGSVATISSSGRSAACVALRLSGFPAWIVWLFVHLAFLDGFGNRFTTMFALVPGDGRSKPHQRTFRWPTPAAT